MATSLDAVIDQMLDCGMPPLSTVDLQVNTQRVVRYGPKKRGWYRIWESVGRSGRTFFAGAFGAYGLVESTRIVVDESTFDPAERERMRAEAAAARAREEQRRAARAARAAMSARELWAEGRTMLHGDVECPYLRRKGVHNNWSELRVDPDGVLLVPMIRYDLAREDALVGMQRIWPDGTKRFGAGTAKMGAAIRIGAWCEEVNGQPVLLCEGIATGLTLASAVLDALPVFCAFDAGNLIPVAEVLRQLYPDSPIGVCADDDWQTPGNPGLLYARRSARRAGRAQVLRPGFRVERSPKATDFNDLQAVEGQIAVRRQLEPFLAFLETV